MKVSWPSLRRKFSQLKCVLKVKIRKLSSYTPPQNVGNSKKSAILAKNGHFLYLLNGWSYKVGWPLILTGKVIFLLAFHTNLPLKSNRNGWNYWFYDLWSKKPRGTKIQEQIFIKNKIHLHVNQHLLPITTNTVYISSNSY